MTPATTTATTTCGICLEDGSRLLPLPTCSHAFCRPCLEMWLSACSENEQGMRRSPTCPFCRVPLPSAFVVRILGQPRVDQSVARISRRRTDMEDDPRRSLEEDQPVGTIAFSPAWEARWRAHQLRLEQEQPAIAARMRGWGDLATRRDSRNGNVHYPSRRIFSFTPEPRQSLATAPSQNRSGRPDRRPEDSSAELAALRSRRLRRFLPSNDHADETVEAPPPTTPLRRNGEVRLPFRRQPRRMSGDDTEPAEQICLRAAVDALLAEEEERPVSVPSSRRTWCGGQRR